MSGHRHLPPGTSIAVRLAHYSEPDLNGGCRLWTAAVSPEGYGTLQVAGRKVGAHRASWEAANGPIPPGMCVCHKCDVRACINPDHLFLGTHQANMTDKAAKGRCHDNSGERHPLAKLTRDDVLIVLARLDAGESCTSIGQRFGVFPSTISFIKSGDRWSSVTGRSRGVAA